MKARLAWVLLWALAGTGCVVPMLEELEADAPLSCDANQLCVTGYSCVKGKCLPGVGRECAEGDTRTCGVERGECTFGLQRCGADGRFGSCDTAQVTVTAFYEGETEISCDGKDNDCDGEVDEALTRLCPLTEGVCAGAQSVCAGGERSACTEATYLARSSAYQPHETLCDGLDNDCDGTEDGASKEVVPSAGQPRLGAALALGQGAAADVVLAWEEGARVWVRRVNADGGLGAPRFPAISVASSPQSHGAAFASCDSPGGDCDVAAWFEQYLCPDAGQCGRLVAGIVHPDGWTHVGTNGSADAGVVTVVFGNDNRDRGGELDLARAGTRLVGTFTLSAQGGGSTVHLVSCNANLGSLCKHTSLGAGEMPSVTLSQDGTQAAVAWQRDAGLVVAGFDLGAVDWSAPPESRLVWDVSGSAGESTPQLLGDPSSALRLYSLGALPDGGAPAVTFRTAIPPMGTTAVQAVATLGASEPLEFQAQAGGLSALTAQAVGETDLLAWQVGSGSAARVWLGTHADAGWIANARPVGSGATRPVLGPPGTLFAEGAGAIQQQLTCFP